jgi:hypothetical protein
VVGDAAHGDGFFTVASGEGELEFAGDEDGIIEEELVEITEAEEEQSAGMLLFGGGVLAHDGRLRDGGRRSGG